MSLRLLSLVLACGVFVAACAGEPAAEAPPAADEPATEEPRADAETDEMPAGAVEPSPEEPAASEAWLVTAEGVGPFMMGASGYEAAELIPEAKLEEGEETVALVAEGYPGLQFSLYDTIIVSATVGEGSALKTPEGIGVGSDVGALQAAYGDELTPIEDYVGESESLFVRAAQSCGTVGLTCEMYFYESGGRIDRVEVSYLF